jgi:hypothetical protein
MPNSWGSPIEIERRRRIRVSVAAYAYEILSESIMPDADFDKLCLEINPQINTGNKVLDKFFKEEFDPSTGQWVHTHPEKEKLQIIYDRHYNGTEKK